MAVLDVFQTNHFQHQQTLQYNRMQRFQSRPLHPHYINQWFDIRLNNSENNHENKHEWCQAQIVDINRENGLMCVRYANGQHGNGRVEWIQCNEENEATLNTHSRIVENSDSNGDQYEATNNRMVMHDSFRVDVRDMNTRKWQRATIIAVDNAHEMVLIRYDFDGSNQRDNQEEWINCESERLAPIGKHTAAIRSMDTRQNFQDTTRRIGENRNPIGTSLSANARLPAAKRRRKYTVTQAIELAFRAKLLQTHGYHVHDMDEDGNCMFRSIAHQVYGNPLHHATVRAKCLEYIKSERLFFEAYIAENFEEYLSRMSRVGEWGDHVELQAMSELYQRPIEIFAFSVEPFKVFAHRTNGYPIRMSYHFQSHYNSIVEPGIFEQHWLQASPGEVEDARIHRSQQLHGVGMSRAQLADVHDTEQETFRQALEVSRQQFQQIDTAEFELAIQSSLEAANLNDERQIALATAESLKTTTSGGLSLEEQQLQHALSLSMCQPSSQENVHKVDSDSDFKNAIELSIQHSHSGNVKSSSSLENDISLPIPVQRCIELGFSSDACIAAYTLLAESAGDDVELITASMTDYLLSCPSNFDHNRR